MSTLRMPPQLALCRSADVLGGAWYVTAECPSFPLHIEAEELEMNLLVRGQVRARVGDAEYQLAPGDLLWLAPGHLHGLLTVSPDAALWVVSFRASLVDCLLALERPLGHGRAGERVCLNLDTLQALSRRCFQLLDLQRDPTRFNRALVELLLQAWRAPDVSHSNTHDPHPAVAKAARELSQSSAQWSLPALSRQVGLSPFQLSRVFHEQTGVTLGHYVHHQRVQRFVKLKARHPQATALELAFEAGFGSYPQFFRVFRAVTGWTPTQHQALLGSAKLPPLSFWL
ncbi:MAG TPA: AraC family transcriptional regulator [Polyangiaceae bacterium]|jgi:AraC-like DNA-binding protein